MIDLELTNADARKLAKHVRQTGDDSLQWVANVIETELAGQAPKAPWRKVVDKKTGIGSDALFLKLECGHSKTFRGTETTFKAESYNRVRCDECATT